MASTRGSRTRTPSRPKAKAKGKPRNAPQTKRDPLRATPPGRLPRDTPVETPVAPLIEPPVAITPVLPATGLSNGPETIEAAYDAWDELRAELAQVRSTFAAERARLEQQGQLLLGAVARVVPSAGGEGLTRRSELEALSLEAQRGLTAARADLDRRSTTAERELLESIDRVKAEVRTRVARQAATMKPSLELMIRVLPQDRRMLQLRRPSPDDAVTLLYAMTGRVPTRYAALFDDSTDDVLLPPQWLYADLGHRDLRPRPAVLREWLEAAPEFWPVKTMLPMVSELGLSRWVARGAVLEAELADGDAFRALLSVEEGEQLTAGLLRLKLAGRIGLELVRG